MRCFPPEHTEKYGRHTQISRNLLLRYTLLKERIFFYEFKIALLRGVGEVLIDSILLGDKGILNNESEKSFKLRYPVVQNIKILF